MAALGVERRLTAAALLLLDRRTRYRAVGAEHPAIAFLGFLMDMFVACNGITLRAMAGSRQCRRTRVSWLVVFVLLFQQLAMSAYACTLTTPPSAQATTMANCAEMSAPSSYPSPQCEKHCHPDHATASPQLAITVPPLALPPPRFDLVSNRPSIGDRRYVDVPISRSDPPPLLRFCSLQI